MVANQPTPSQPDYKRLLNSLLDSGYTNAIRPVVEPLLNETNRGLIRQRLTELEAEAQRLQDLGQRLTPDNPVVRALRADLNDVLRNASRQMNTVAGDIQQTGVDAGANFLRQSTLRGLSDQQLARIGANFNRVSPETINQLVTYIDSDAFRTELAQYAQGIDDVVNNIIVRGVAEGWSPLRIARVLSNTVQGLPLARANALMRTLQLNSYRATNATYQLANADILEPTAIRIATLDGRTCLGCVALHGTELPLGRAPEDHRNGRCISVAQLRGRPLNIQTGEQWINTPAGQARLSRQPAIANALNAGAITLQDMVSRGTDDVFGAVIGEASLRGVLGNSANQYYRRNQ